MKNNSNSFRPKDMKALRFAPLTPALTAARALLQQQLATMDANETDIRTAIDPECLHDFRVAIRRTRSLLGQLKKTFPPAVLSRFRREFAWLGQITGPPRDLDVYLLAFPQLLAALPAEGRADLAPLQDYLQSRRNQEQQLLIRRLRGKRYGKLLADWRDWLQRPVTDQPSGVQADQPIGRIADRRIRRAFRLVIRQGGAIGPESPAEAFHDLRKNCKKLRYLLEFFAGLYAGKPLADIIKALKGLQDHLGALQDLAVQVEALRNFSLRLTAAGRLPPATLQAMGTLIEQLQLRQLDARRQLNKPLTDFSSKPNRQRFKTLFPPHRAAGEA
jgi:CHAD domain-containing protein